MCKVPLMIMPAMQWSDSPRPKIGNAAEGRRIGLRRSDPNKGEQGYSGLNREMTGELPLRL